MKNQYEQQCNAVALSQMGVPVLDVLSVETLPALQEWVGQEKALQVPYPDIAGAVVDRVLEAHAPVFA
jgi:hypothetical protein